MHVLFYYAAMRYVGSNYNRMVDVKERRNDAKMHRCANSTLNKCAYCCGMLQTAAPTQLFLLLIGVHLFAPIALSLVVLTIGSGRALVGVLLIGGIVLRINFFTHSYCFCALALHYRRVGRLIFVYRIVESLIDGVMPHAI